MTLHRDNTRGVSLSLKWSEVVGLLLFAAVIGPGLFYTGQLTNRVARNEQVIEEMRANQREIANTQRQLADIQSQSAARITIVETELMRRRQENEVP